MSPKLLVLAASVAALLPAAADAGARYEKATFLHSGYSDEQVAPDSWVVTGLSIGEEGGGAIALYRAAALANAAGAREIRITRQMITQKRRGGSIYNEFALLKVVAIRAPADRTLCQMKRTERCVTARVASLMAQYGPLLGQPTLPTGAAAALAPAPTPAATAGTGLSPYAAGRAAARAALAASAEPGAGG